jgi:hypothetical protein
MVKPMVLKHPDIKPSPMILHLDMDGVCADLYGRLEECDPGFHKKIEELGWPKSRDYFGDLVRANPSVFCELQMLKGCREAIDELKELYDIFWLSTPMWDHPQSYMDKRLWLEANFGALAYKKLILTSRKDLVVGDFLVDDNWFNGAKDFMGEFIHFGTEKFPDWPTVTNYLKTKALN